MFSQLDSGRLVPPYIHFQTKRRGVLLPGCTCDAYSHNRLHRLLPAYNTRMAQEDGILDAY